MIKAYEICLQMLEQRNYSILDRDDERILAQKPNNEPMCVFFATASKFNVES